MREPLVNPEPLGSRVAAGRGALPAGFALMLLGTVLLAAWTQVLPLGVSPRWAVGSTGLIATLVGWMLVRQARRSRARRHRLDEGRARHPHEPWRYDHPWNPAGAGERPGPDPFDVAMEVALYVSFALPFNLWAFEAGWSAPGVPLAALLFDLSFAHLSARAIRDARGRARNGRCRLLFPDRFPFRLGETARVTFLPRQPLEPRFVLRCIEESGEESFELFRETQEWACDASGLELEFQLPDRPGLGTRLDHPTALRYWRLDVMADLPDGERTAGFLLPVYAQVSLTAAADPQRDAVSCR